LVERFLLLRFFALIFDIKSQRAQESSADKIRSQSYEVRYNASVVNIFKHHE
jgi:hypothetical protein